MTAAEVLGFLSPPESLRMRRAYGTVLDFRNAAGKGMSMKTGKERIYAFG
jgi:hypothetical protein